MHWYFIIWAATGMGVGGPFDTKEACLADLEQSQPVIIDPGFYNPPLSAGGLCLEAAAPAWYSKR